MRRMTAVTTTMLATVLACSPPPPDQPSPDGTEAAAAVAALTAEAWEHLLERNPYLQNRQGMLVTTLPDLTEEEAARDIAWSRDMLERIEAIPLETLSHDDALTLECLRWDNRIVVESEPWYWHQFPITPYSAGYLANSTRLLLGAYDLSDPSHLDMYARLVGEAADYLQQLVEHTRGQTERGIYMASPALPGISGLFGSLRDGGVRAVVVPAPERLEAVPEAERDAFVARIDEIVSGRMEPAIDELLALLDSEDYRANAPREVGAGAYPDGEAWYRYLVRANITMDKTPEELHETGKRRVAELEADMAAIRAELGFEGTREEFHDLLRTDERFLARTPEDVEERYMSYIEAIEPRIPEYFRTRPRAPSGVKRLDPAQEATMTFGFYQQPTPAEPVGYYRYNGSKLDERSMVWAGPLIFHELVPGHHFHIALQNENEALPPYRRENIAYGAFTEGWANYAALVAKEMGLLDDPWDRYGWDLFEIFFATRLVVDTGMNYYGWSLEEGRAYMREHTFQSETEIGTESLRYSTDMPGQALNYYAGFQRLVELRERARTLAGESFDIRDFHDAVLDPGGLPMEVLEKHIEWTFDPERGRTPRG